MSGEIQLLLTVDDKGSATVRSATERMNAELRKTEQLSHNIGSAFNQVSSRISRFTAGLFSFSGIIGTLGGAAGITMVTKRLLEMAEQTKDENFVNSMGILNREWGGFTEKVGLYVANSPALNQGLRDLAAKVTEWGTTLTENKVVLEDWATFAVNSVKKVGDALVSAMSGMSKLAREAPISTMREKDVIPTLMDRMTGTGGGFNDVGSYVGPAAETRAGEMDFRSLPTSEKNAIVNMYVNERMSSHQLAAEVSDALNRMGFRDSNGYYSGSQIGTNENGGEVFGGDIY